MHRRPALCALLPAACALALGCASNLARAEWQIEVDPGILYDSNLTRAYAPADVRADQAFTLIAIASTPWVLSGADWVTFSARARSELYHRFAGLNIVGVGGSAAYRHKFGVGLAAPYVELSVDGAYDDYHSSLRDGARVEARAELGKRFTPDFDAAFGGSLERRYAPHDEPAVPGISGRVFALRGQSLFARAGYWVTDNLRVGAELSVRRGDVVATTRPNLEIFVVSDAIAPDPTFGPDFFAYRLRGTTDTAQISGSWAIDERSSLNLVYRDERTDAAGGVDYRSHSVELLYAWRYY